MARQPQTIGDFLFNEIRSATRDIRNKLFDEAWFGRVMNVDPVRDHYRPMPENLRPSSFEEAWGTAKPADRQREQAPEWQDPSHDIDR